MVLSLFCRWKNEQNQMDFDMAVDIHALLHHSKLQQTTLGEVFYGDIRVIHSLDCLVLLLHGVDGKCI